jgi:hypothetical protein
MSRESQTMGLVKQSYTPSAFWMCYRCNLTFHEESSVSLHNDITKHSARMIEFSQGRDVIA